MTKKKLAGGFILAMLLVVAIVAYVQAQSFEAENGIAESASSQDPVQRPVADQPLGDGDGNGLLGSVEQEETGHEPAIGQSDEAGNGFPASLTSGSAALGPVVVDGLWYQFAWSGGTVSGCPGCTPIPDISENADDPPWTFTAGPGGALLTVTDAYLNGDQFEVFDFGVSQGLTSSVLASGSCGSNPVDCMADPNASTGVFYLDPGQHSITLALAANPFGNGAAFFRVDSIKVEVDGPWYEFAWSGSGVSGCSPADPSGPGCSPSSSGNSVFAEAPPWTFIAGPDGAVLTVADAFLNGDQFEVFDFGSSLGLTSTPDGGSCGDDPVPCMSDPDNSTGTFYLGSGPHSITISLAGGFSNGAAYFRVDSGNVIIEGPWYEWGWDDTNTVKGCTPADPGGYGCVPSSGGNSVFVGAPPWTFTAPSGGATLSVTDAFLNGDRFEVFDDGTSLGLTSETVATGSCGDDPVPCLANPNSSSAIFYLDSGMHSITFEILENPYNAGRAYFRVDSYTVFLPIIMKNP